MKMYNLQINCFRPQLLKYYQTKITCYQKNQQVRNGKTVVILTSRLSLDGHLLLSDLRKVVYH